jgi:hypothetical protein
MVRMRAEFVGFFAKARTRFADNGSAFTHRTVCLQCSRKWRSPPQGKSGLNQFLECKKHETADIHRQLCEVYGEHVMSDSIVRRWVRQFNEGCENVHDDPRSGNFFTKLRLINFVFGNCVHAGC